MQTFVATCLKPSSSASANCSFLWDQHYFQPINVESWYQTRLELAQQAAHGTEAVSVLTSSLVELTPQLSQRVSLPRGGTGRTIYGRSHANFCSTEGWWESAGTHTSSGRTHSSCVSTGSWRQPFYLVLQLHHTEPTRTEQYTHTQEHEWLFFCLEHRETLGRTKKS